MEKLPQSSASWLSRVQILDDAPMASDPSADMLGLAPLARGLARSLLSNGNSMVVHVDGEWGRGKTSFCKMVERHLKSEIGKPADSAHESRPGHTAEKCDVAWYVASDSEPAGHRALMYQVLKAVIDDEDREEIASLMRHFDIDGDGELEEPTFDRFRDWLARELGWDERAQVFGDREAKIPLDVGADASASPRVTGGRRLSADDLGAANPPAALQSAPGSGRDLRLKLTRQRRKLAVVIVDDLDRCSREWVGRLLDSMRLYVNCRGVSFIVSADREVIVNAFGEIVKGLGVDEERTGAEALEKYIRHTVRIPEWSGKNDSTLATKLKELQRRLSRDGRTLPLLTASPLDLQDGVAFKLAIYLPRSLSVRRLKRVLNRFAVDMARVADRLELSEDQLGQGGTLWAGFSRRVKPVHLSAESRTSRRDQEQRYVEPIFDEVHVESEGDYAAFFFGHLIVVVLEEAWPAPLSGVLLGSEQFSQRMRALSVLGASVRAPVGVSEALSADVFDTVVGAVVGEQVRDPTPSEVRREVCDFVASVYADLGLGARFLPRDANFFLLDEGPIEQDPADRRQTSRSSASPVKLSVETPDHEPAAKATEAKAGVLAHELKSLADVMLAPASAQPPVLARAVQLAGLVPENAPPPVVEAMNAVSEAEWPLNATLAAVEYAGKLAEAGRPVEAFRLLARSYTQSTQYSHLALAASEHAAYRWSLAEGLSALVSRWPGHRESLTSIAEFPPRQPPECGSAWQAAASLVEGGLVAAGNDVEAHLFDPLEELFDRIPSLAWTAVQILRFPLIAVRDRPALLREIGERMLQPTGAARLDVATPRRQRLMLETATALASTQSHTDLVIRLYEELRNEHLLPIAEFHNLGLVYRAAGRLEDAGRYWEAAYREGALEGVGVREFATLLEAAGRPNLESIVAERGQLPDDEVFAGASGLASQTSVPPELDRTTFEDVQSPQLILEQLRPIQNPAMLGVLGVVVPGLFRRWGELAGDDERGDIEVEANHWVTSQIPPSRMAIELARAWSEIGLDQRARGLLERTAKDLAVVSPPPNQLLWQVIGALMSKNGLEAEDELTYDLAILHRLELFADQHAQVLGMATAQPRWERIRSWFRQAYAPLGDHSRMRLRPAFVLEASSVMTVIGLARFFSQAAGLAHAHAAQVFVVGDRALGAAIEADMDLGGAVFRRRLNPVLLPTSRVSEKQQDLLRSLTEMNREGWTPEILALAKGMSEKLAADPEVSGGSASAPG